MQGLTANQIRDLLRLQLPEPRPDQVWQLDHEALLEALDRLAIELPVLFFYRKYSGKYWLTHGNHRARKDPPRHEIRLNQDLPTAKANGTVWHELAHAMQTERFASQTGNPHSDFYDKAYKTLEASGPWGASYVENIYEVEAEKLAKSHAQDWLITPTTGGN